MDNTTIYQNNTAGVYAPIYATPPSLLKVTFLTNNDYQSARILGADGFPPIVSGIPFSFIVTVYDTMGQVYAADSQSVATFENTTKILSITGNRVVADKGVYKFENVRVIMEPGSQASFRLKIQNGMTEGNP